MTPSLARAVVRGELNRIRKVGGEIDRRYLRRETGLKSQQLEAMISDCALELIAGESMIAGRK